MEFGYMIDFRNPPGSGLDFAQLYSEMFRQIEFIENAGFDSVWLTEHHFTDDGYMPEAFSHAALARRTKHIRGFYVFEPRDHFLSLLYHAVYHKGSMAEDYAFRLVDLARQAGIQIIAPGSKLRGIHTPALKGGFDVRARPRHISQGSAFAPEACGHQLAPGNVRPQNLSLRI